MHILLQLLTNTKGIITFLRSLDRYNEQNTLIEYEQLFLSQGRLLND